ncbi:MAG: sn-glycerol-3-phosphate ABC transporter ATP-binding protein UgpC [Gammaproteobacteria bacterium]|nr:sn-glycerol-3-phosphate ABC transporter ATP-binding protein UgpC [Gammaproteobacteria bacterium]
MGAIKLEKIEKWFGDVQVIKGIDLEIQDGEMVVFVGPSGCGKSTLLRMIAGLEETSYGEIYLDGERVTDKVPSERALSMVFQSYALYPHMNVEDNVGFSLKIAGVPAGKIAKKVKETSSILELDAYLKRRPKELSGGQRQRVAIGRAIVREPKGFLFDEPLSNLDAALRVQMRFEIAKLHERLKSTMIYVTHDQVEAMTLADKIVVLRDGIVEQVGTPRDLYEAPSSVFVAQFIGSPKMNILDGSQTAKGFALSGHGVLSHKVKNDKPLVKCGIRPEHISVTEKSADVAGEVVLYEYLGSDCFIYVDCAQLGVITVRVSDEIAYETGQQASLKFDRKRIHFFDEAGQAAR